MHHTLNTKLSSLKWFLPFRFISIFLDILESLIQKNTHNLISRMILVCAFVIVLIPIHPLELLLLIFLVNAVGVGILPKFDMIELN